MRLSGRCWAGLIRILAVAALSFSAVESSGQGETVKGLIYYAVENLENPDVTLRGVAGSQGFAFDRITLSPNTRYKIWLLEAATFQIAVGEVTTPGSGRSFRFPDFEFRIASSHDTDGDGLHDLGEYIMGTFPLVTDSDEDGVPDGAEVRQGTDPLDGIPARTGILGSADTPGFALDVTAFNDVVVLADSPNGIAVFNIFNGMPPLIIAQINTPGTVSAVSMASNLVAVADGEAGLVVIDVSDPPNSVVNSRVLFTSEVRAVASEGQVAYAGLSNGVVAVVDLPSGAVLLDFDVSTKAIEDVFVAGDHVYALVEGRLHVLRLAGGEFIEVGSVATSGGVNVTNKRMRLFVGGGIAYVTHARGYNTIDVSNPAAPVEITNSQKAQLGWKQIVGNGSGLGLATTGLTQPFSPAHNLFLYDISDPSDTDNVLAEFATPSAARAVTVYNGIAYVADHESGLHVVNYLAFDTGDEAPVVSLEASVPGTDLEEGSRFRISASVTDDVQVRNVEFYVDGTRIATDGNFPFEVRLNAPLLGDQTTVSVRARASDTRGNASFSETLTFDLVPDQTPPIIRNAEPRPGTIAGNVSQISAFASEGLDPDTVTAVTFAVYGTGEDGLTGNADDVRVDGGVVSQDSSGSILSLTFAEPLEAGFYRIRLLRPMADFAGNQLKQNWGSGFRAVGGDDSDGDGIIDSDEASIGLDPFNPDTNSNGIPDGEEDMDSDGVPNAAEFVLGFDPQASDSDSDGIPDAQEDADADNLPDFEETLIGTRPDRIDSDGDGLDDYSEILDGSDPVDAESGRNEIVESRSVTFFNGAGQYGSEPDMRFVSSGAVTFFNDLTHADDGTHFVASPPVTTLNQ